MSTPDFQAPSLEGMNSLLPSYEFHDLLASNSQGAVYYATQKSLDRQVAIKVFAPVLASDPSFKRLYANCTASAAGIRHSNLIGIYNSGFVDGMPYLAMEFVPGKSLARSMRRGSIDVKQSMAILNQVCEGVAHAHGKHLIHGNLTPHDILLNQQASPKVGNFGLGPDVHTHGEVEMPTHFTAPEALDGGAATEASDLYSLAALFYEMVTGTPYRFGGPSISELEDLPEAVDEVMRKALSKDPEKRGKDPLEFYQSLKQALKPKREKPAPAAAPAKASSKLSSKALAKPKTTAGLLVRLAIIGVLLFCIHQVLEHRKSVKERRELVSQEETPKAVTVTREVQRIPAQPQPQPQPPARPVGPQPVAPPVSENLDFPDVQETSRDSLERLRVALTQGRMDELPLGTITRGDSHFLEIEEAMTWPEALVFAEKHGGSLALPDGEMTSRQVWLGVARSGAASYTRLDGKPWAPPSGMSGNEAFVCLDPDGKVQTAGPNASNAFVVQWSAQGPRATSLETRLAATASSIKSGAPVYPPGTMAVGDRHYLAVAREASWAEAKTLAESAGGHLAVLSDEAELNALQQVTTSLPSARELWANPLFPS